MFETLFRGVRTTAATADQALSHALSTGVTGRPGVDGRDYDDDSSFAGYPIPGPTGVSGSTGASGIHGMDGEDGEQGFPGLVGSIGPTGLGTIGPPGIDGESFDENGWPEGFGGSPNTTTFIASKAIGVAANPLFPIHIKSSGAAQTGRFEAITPAASLITAFEFSYTTDPGFGTKRLIFQDNTDGQPTGFAFGQAAAYTGLGTTDFFQIWSRNGKKFNITVAGSIVTSVPNTTVANDASAFFGISFQGAASPNIQHTIITQGTYITSSAKGGFAGVKIGDTINQTTDTSTTYGVWIDPTLTAAADFRAIGINSAGAYGVYQSSTTPANYFAGKIGIGVTVPTSMLHLKAGTASANTAPLKFNTGTLLTTAEAGAIEFLTDAYYGTITTGAARKTFAFLESPVLVTPTIGVATGTSLSLSNTVNLISTGGAATAGQLTLGVGGTLTVNTTAMTATALLFCQRKTAGGTIGFATTYTQVNGTSFTLSSDSALDTSVYNWWIVETH